MRARRFLLVTAALSTTAAIEGCGKDTVPKVEPIEAGEVNMPANPKGSHYDDGLNEPPPPPPPPPPPVTDAGRRIPYPANPKGSHYDAGMTKPPKR